MIVADLIKYLEDWAPPGAAWERDNVGLQVGSGAEKVRNLMLCLELTDEVLLEARQKKCNFIFTHHPLIFNPIKKLDTEKDSTAKLIELLIKNNITLYSAHTNLDFARDGVSFELARMLKLKNISFLENEEGNQYKIALFVPHDALENVTTAMFNAGAGVIGEYEKCSFSVNGKGTFQGSKNSNPAIGKKNVLETVEELHVEMIVDAWKLNNVIASILKTHPYEEPAYDVYPLKNKNVNYGAGAIGELESEMDEKHFLNYIAKSIGIKNFKFCEGKNKKIRRVAVCGGSGSELLKTAIKKNADAFITADIKYHTYHDALGKILLVDAGHYETEIFALNAVERKIKEFLETKSEKKIELHKFSGTTNPINFYKQ